MGFLLNSMGGPPMPGTPEMDTWCRSSAAFARAYCDGAALPRTVIYVDGYAGSDSNDGLTPATAWRSISKVQTDISALDSAGKAADGNYRWYKFAASPMALSNPAGALGGAYPTTAGLNVSKPFVKITSWDPYGYASYVDDTWGAPTAIITACKGGYSSWTSAGSGAYYAAETTPIYQVIDLGAQTSDPASTYPLTKCASLAEVQAQTTGGWWWDSGTNRLYIKRYDGSNPSGNIIWGVQDTNGANAGIYITADGCYVEGMSFIGFGYGTGTVSSQVNQCYCARITFSGNSVACFRGCVTAYGPYHVRGLYGSVAGGCVVWDTCRFGFARYDNSSGTTVGNSFNSAGSHEMASIDNVMIGGVIPNTGIAGGTGTYIGEAELCHASGSNKCGLHIVHGFTWKTLTKGKMTRGVAMNDMPIPAQRNTWSDYRGVYAMSTEPHGTGFQKAAAIIRDGLLIQKTPTASALETLIVAESGVFVGCRFELDFSGAALDGTEQFWYNPGPGSDVEASGVATLSGITRATVAISTDGVCTVTAVTGTPTGWTSPVAFNLLDYATIDAVYTQIAAATNNQVTLTSANSMGPYKSDALSIMTLDTGGSATKLRAVKPITQDHYHCEFIITPHASATAFSIDYNGYQVPAANYQGNSKKSRYFNCYFVRASGTATMYANQSNQTPSFDGRGKQGGMSCCAFYGWSSANEGGARNYRGYGNTATPVTLSGAPTAGVVTSELMQGGKLPDGIQVRRTYQGIKGDYRNVIGATRRGPSGARRTRARSRSRTTNAAGYRQQS